MPRCYGCSWRSTVTDTDSSRYVEYLYRLRETRSRAAPDPTAAAPAGTSTAPPAARELVDAALARDPPARRRRRAWTTSPPRPARRKTVVYRHFTDRTGPVRRGRARASTPEPARSGRSRSAPAHGRRARPPRDLVAAGDRRLPARWSRRTPRSTASWSPPPARPRARRRPGRATVDRPHRRRRSPPSSPQQLRRRRRATPPPRRRGARRWSGWCAPPPTSGWPATPTGHDPRRARRRTSPTWPGPGSPRLARRHAPHAGGPHDHARHVPLQRDASTAGGPPSATTPATDLDRAARSPRPRPARPRSTASSDRRAGAGCSPPPAARSTGFPAIGGEGDVGGVGHRVRDARLRRPVAAGQGRGAVGPVRRRGADLGTERHHDRVPAGDHRRRAARLLRDDRDRPRLRRAAPAHHRDLRPRHRRVRRSTPPTRARARTTSATPPATGGWRRCSPSWSPAARATACTAFLVPIRDDERRGDAGRHDRRLRRARPA